MQLDREALATPEIAGRPEGLDLTATRHLVTGGRAGFARRNFDCRRLPALARPAVHERDALDDHVNALLQRRHRLARRCAQQKRPGGIIHPAVVASDALLTSKVPRRASS